MKQEITKALADGAIALAVGGGVANKLGWFAFINDNAPALGLIASCAFGVIGIIFYALTYSKSTLADKNEQRLLMQTKHLELLTNKVNKVLEKLNSQNNDKG